MLSYLFLEMVMRSFLILDIYTYMYYVLYHTIFVMGWRPRSEIKSYHITQITSRDLHLSRLVRKPDFCICEIKDADQLRGFTAKLISVFVFATQIVRYLYFLYPKFQGFNHPL